MKLAIMQPYLFPYLGYFQLIAAVDRFVILDDAHFIKQGWINRNTILGPDGPLRITVPVAGASSNRRICELDISAEERWRNKLCRSLEQTYGRAPCFNAVWPWVNRALCAPVRNLADFLRLCLTATLDYAGIQTEIVPTSRAYGNDDLRGQERVIDICLREGASHYVNSQGGVELYSAERFRASGLSLHFLHPEPEMYPQFSGAFVPSLSILDVLMFNPPERLRTLLSQYRLVSGASLPAPSHG